MNKIIYIGMLSVSIFLFADNIEEKKSIDFLLNECTLKIPYGYNGGVNVDGDIMFTPSFSLHLKNYVAYQIRLIEKNATKSLLDNNTDLNSHEVNSMGHLNIIRINTNTSKSNGYIVGKHFYLYSGNLDHNYTKELINSCNNSWHEDMQIVNLDILPLKLVEDFPFMFGEKKAMKIQKKLQAIAELSSDEPKGEK